jgi:hypothetical protein
MVLDHLKCQNIKQKSENNATDTRSAEKGHNA